jgi:hypothetical protein
MHLACPNNVDREPVQRCKPTKSDRLKGRVSIGFGKGF